MKEIEWKNIIFTRDNFMIFIKFYRKIVDYLQKFISIFILFVIALHKGAFWLIITLFFGLFQVWHTVIISALSNTNDFSGVFYNLLPDFCNDGILLLFSITIVTSITIDYHLSLSSFNDDLCKNALLIFAFTWFPIIIITSSIWIFTTQPHLPENTAHILLNAHVAIFIITCIYAFLTKTLKFLFDKINKEGN